MKPILTAILVLSAVATALPAAAARLAVVRRRIRGEAIWVTLWFCLQSPANPT